MPRTAMKCIHKEKGRKDKLGRHLQQLGYTWATWVAVLDIYTCWNLNALNTPSCDYLFRSAFWLSTKARTPTPAADCGRRRAGLQRMVGPQLLLLLFSSAAAPVKGCAEEGRARGAAPWGEGRAEGVLPPPCWPPFLPALARARSSSICCWTPCCSDSSSPRCRSWACGCLLEGEPSPQCMPLRSKHSARRAGPGRSCRSPEADCGATGRCLASREGKRSTSEHQHITSPVSSKPWRP